MVTRLTTPIVLVPQLTQITAVGRTAAAATRNFTNGPGILHLVIVDNQKAAASNTKVYVKIYDITSQGWAPGTSLPIIIFPIVTWTSNDDSQGIGTYRVFVIPGGMPFENGLSVSVDQGAGDALGTAPATDVSVEFVTT